MNWQKLAWNQGHARAGTVWSQGTNPPVSQTYWFFIHFLTCGKETVASEPRAELTNVDKLQRVEAVLVVAKESLSSRKLAQVAGLADATEARTLVRLLNHRYDSGGRAFRIEEVAGGFCLLTRPQFAPWLRRLRHIPGELRLTQSAMETLAIVAYRQPVPRADIEAIRGVSSGEMLKQLMQRDLVRICGRSEDLGRPYLYGTTRTFLQMFGLRNADRLPRSEWINGPNGIAPVTALPPGTAHLNNEESGTAPSVDKNMSKSSSQYDAGTGKDAKESTVTKSFSATLLQGSVQLADDLHHNDVLGNDFLNNGQSLRAVDDDDDEFFDEDEDEDEEDDDEEFEEEEFDDDEEEEFEDDEAEEEADGEEEEAFEDEEEDDWEEVDDEEETEDGEDEDEWDDEDDEDWDDDDDDDAEDEDEDWD